MNSFSIVAVFLAVEHWNKTVSNVFIFELQSIHTNYSGPFEVLVWGLFFICHLLMKKWLVDEEKKLFFPVISPV